MMEATQAKPDAPDMNMGDMEMSEDMDMGNMDMKKMNMEGM